MTIWADLAPWLLAMTGVFTVTKGVSKILAKSQHPDFAKWSTRVEASGEISTGLVAFVVFCLWVTQYADGPLWALKVVATSVGLLLVVLFFVSISDSRTTPGPDCESESEII